MVNNPKLVPTIYDGWQAYQEIVIQALRPLDKAQLAQRAGTTLRSVDEITKHIIDARARWFYLLMGEGGEAFQSMGKWDRRGGRARRAEELVDGFPRTWQGMFDAIDGWSPEDWQMSWPGEDNNRL